MIAGTKERTKRFGREASVVAILRPMLQGAALIQATRPFAKEHRGRSWWCLFSTLALLGVTLAAGALPLHWWARLSGGLLAGLLLCRMFIILHDHQHGSILRRSKIAKAVVLAYGVLTLNPASTWNLSHNHHHRHNAKIRGANIGSFPVMTTAAWAKAGAAERFVYAASRHPLTILLAWVTVFFYGMTLRSFLRKPRRHSDCGVALLLHAAVWVSLLVFWPGAVLYSFVIPCGVASALGAYLFYAQHNYPDVVLCDNEKWDYTHAALRSSSFLDAGPLMHYFTGNIGYHHVHHLNSRIPFYRLPEAMASIPELRSPGRTSLRLADIRACFRLKLWDESRQKMVAFDGR